MRVELGFVKLTGQLYTSLARNVKVIQAPNSRTAVTAASIVHGPTATFEMINFSADDDYC
jgi:hypothetical protein